jgi:hypothetical protein
MLHMQLNSPAATAIVQSAGTLTSAGISCTPFEIPIVASNKHAMPFWFRLLAGPALQRALTFKSAVRLSYIAFLVYCRQVTQRTMRRGLLVTMMGLMSSATPMHPTQSRRSQLQTTARRVRTAHEDAQPLIWLTVQSNPIACNLFRVLASSWKSIVVGICHHCGAVLQQPPAGACYSRADQLLAANPLYHAVHVMWLIPRITTLPALPTQSLHTPHSRQQAACS